MNLLDGKLVAEKIKAEIATEVKTKMLDAGREAPHLAAILVGDDPASQTYVASKEKDCLEVGFISSVYRYPANITQDKLLESIRFLNADPEVDGFIVQLPLPKHLDEHTIIESIHPAKDVDGFHPVNVGRMVLNIPSYLPATPYGIVTLLEHYKIETEGKHCVVLGRSNIVGTPISILLSRKSKTGNATVTLCHSHTSDIKAIAASADILIVAMGKKGFVTADMVKKDAVVVDVGIHRIPAKETKSGYRLVGDVDFQEVAKKCSYITPVPGGVGPMTRVSLLLNTLKAAKKEIKF
ncbi:MAG: bifunctional 5,10-methylenetetrahydrofolate dehydrogenase/5,10-methenyltetrahydrofolate cyclohydrolase [Bacteroidetes bacterium]|nr:bifunctional 5,10-methylenetetrahydrofolate dehydrogenase/5,10-methenyltetrahydrofolate cyclohydrolase [Bacteroidota bacterium]